MNQAVVRVLFVADTHLGFDLPFRPRIERRRRGHDFFANFEEALRPAHEGNVDLVVHGGDLFYRSRVPATLVEMALAPLIRVAEQGIPVYLVPGNHERSRIPLHLWSAQPNMHIFDQPRTFLCAVAGGSVALSGFPFAQNVRDRFSELVSLTRYHEVEADFRLLCLHQTVEGAQVGPSNYTFRSGPDVMKGQGIPSDFGAVLAGHIHRAQVLTHDLRNRRLPAPVIYPGSIERTSFAERNEDKGYVILSAGLSERERGRPVDVCFMSLPARPMVCLVLEAGKPSTTSLTDHLRRRLSALDPNSVVRLQIRGAHATEVRAILSAAILRELAPPSMNIWLAPDRVQRSRKSH
jgi:DNA repair exonuclease SbcCD nuclease subunit